MNKFLMMSAAVVMGTMTATVSQLASAAENSKVILHSAPTGTGSTYCDNFIIRILAKTAAGGHEYSPCAHSSGQLPVNGFLEKKSVVLSDISYPVLFSTIASATWVFSYPLNKVKKGVRLSTWDVWASTNASTAFLVNSGWQGPASGAKKNSGRTSMMLDSLLKANQKH